MIIHFCIYLIPTVWSSDALSDTMVDMKQEIPGSVEFFTAWGAEEAQLDHYRDLITGVAQTGVPHRPLAPLRYSDLAALIHYHFQPVSLQQVAQIVAESYFRGLIVLRHPIETLSFRIYSYRDDFATMPSHVFDLIAARLSPYQILPIVREDARFNSIEKIQLAMQIWSVLCINRLNTAHPETPPPCALDETANTWRLTDQCVHSFLRWYSLTGIRRRENSQAV